uniref:Uncharacterized protein n=1 Tax=Arundo donax TaxID=35708 RepID=A0A0A9C8L4_ARUDO
MLPSKVFMLRFRCLSLLRRPSSDGIAPWKLLFDSCSLVRADRFPMHGNMDPEMPSDASSSAITRRGALTLQVTPCQLQNSTDALLHVAKTWAGPDSWDLKQRRACRSFSLSTHMADGMLLVKMKR